jgi:polysaccharide biosynthesis protein
MRRGDLVDEMRTIAPPGEKQLSPRTVEVLARKTSELVAISNQACIEFRRYRDTASRMLASNGDTTYLKGKCVLVTGGTGCIGSALLREITSCTPARLVSVSRGKRSTIHTVVSGVDYIYADVTDRQTLSGVFDLVRPEVVFHLAAQRDPGLAEVNVGETIRTNVLGTRNVLWECQGRHVGHLIYASTGKTVRIHSADIYVTTKRIGECMLAAAASRNDDTSVAAVRFTHVVDNSIVFDRIKDGCTTGLIRLHDPYVGFYVQSALESAQLLLAAGSVARPHSLMVHAIRNLGWPIDLLDLTLGYLAAEKLVTAVYFCGFEPGYDRIGYAGLHDPDIAGEVSPLINSFEARQVEGEVMENVNAFPAVFSDGADLNGRLDELDELCGKSAGSARDAIAQISRYLLDCTLSAVSSDELARAGYLADLSRSPDECEAVRLIGDRVRYWASFQSLNLRLG